MPVDLWLGRGGCEDIWYLRRTESSFISKEVFQPPYRWDPMVWQSIASLCCLVQSQFCSLSFWAKYLNIYIYIYTHIHTYIYIYVYRHMYVTYIYIYRFFQYHHLPFSLAFSGFLGPGHATVLADSFSEAKDLQELISWDISSLQPLQGSQ